MSESNKPQAELKAEAPQDESPEAINWQQFVFKPREEHLPPGEGARLSEKGLQDRIAKERGKGGVIAYFIASQLQDYYRLVLPWGLEVDEKPIQLVVHKETFRVIDEITKLPMLTGQGEKQREMTLEEVIKEFAPDVQILLVKNGAAAERNGQLVCDDVESFLESVAVSRPALLAVKKDRKEEVDKLPVSEQKVELDGGRGEEHKRDEKEVKGGPPSSAPATRPFQQWQPRNIKAKVPVQQTIQVGDRKIVGENKIFLAHLLGVSNDDEIAPLSPDVPQMERLLAEPALPGRHSAADVYTYAADQKEKRAIAPSDHPRAVSDEFKVGGKGFRVTSFNIGGPNKDGNSAAVKQAALLEGGILHVGQAKSVLTHDNAVLESRQDLIIADLVAAAKDPKQYSSVIGLQEYWLDPIDKDGKDKLIAALNEATKDRIPKGEWDILSPDGCDFPILYNKADLDLVKGSEVCNLGIKVQSATFEVRGSKSRAFFTAHNGHLEATAPDHRIQEILEQLEAETRERVRKIIPPGTEHWQVSLMDFNKERPPLPGSPQIVPFEFRQEEGQVVQGGAHTDGFILCDSKGESEPLGAHAYVFDGRPGEKQGDAQWLKGIQKSDEKVDLSPYSPLMRKDMARMRGYPPLTTDEWKMVVIPEKKTTLRDYQKKLDTITPYLRVMPAGNNAGQRCFLQINASNELGKKEAYAVKSFLGSMQALLQKAPPSIEPGQIEFTSNEIGFKQHLMNIRESAVMPKLDQEIERYKTYVKSLTDLQALCADLNAVCIDYEGGQWVLRITVDEGELPEAEIVKNLLEKAFREKHVVKPEDISKNLAEVAADKNIAGLIKAAMQKKEDRKDLKLNLVKKLGINSQFLQMEEVPEDVKGHAGQIRIAVQHNADYLPELERRGFENTGVGFLYAPRAAVQALIDDKDFKKPGGNYVGQCGKLNEVFQDMMGDAQKLVFSSVGERGAVVSGEPPMFEYFYQVIKDLPGVERQGKNIIIPLEQLKAILSDPTFRNAYKPINDLPLSSVVVELAKISEDDLSVERFKDESGAYLYRVKLTNPTIFTLGGISDEPIKIGDKFSCILTHDKLQNFHSRLKRAQQKILRGEVGERKEEAGVVQDEAEPLLATNFLRDKIGKPAKAEVVAEVMLATQELRITQLPLHVADWVSRALKDKVSLEIFEKIQRGPDDGRIVDIYFPVQAVAPLIKVFEDFFKETPEFIATDRRLKDLVNPMMLVRLLKKVMDVNVPEGFRYELPLTNAEFARSFVMTEFARQNKGHLIQVTPDGGLSFPSDQLPAVEACIRSYYAENIVNRPSQPGMNVGKYTAWLKKFFVSPEVGRVIDNGKEYIAIRLSNAGLDKELRELVANDKSHASGAKIEGNKLIISRDQILQFDNWLIGKTDFLHKAIASNMWTYYQDPGEAKENRPTLSPRGEKVFQDEVLPELLQTDGRFDAKIFTKWINALTPKDKVIKNPEIAAVQIIGSQLALLINGKPPEIKKKTPSEKYDILEKVFNSKSGFYQFARMGTTFGGLNGIFKKWEARYKELDTPAKRSKETLKDIQESLNDEYFLLDFYNDYLNKPQGRDRVLPKPIANRSLNARLARARYLYLLECSQLQLEDDDRSELLTETMRATRAWDKYDLRAASQESKAIKKSESKEALPAASDAKLEAKQTVETVAARRIVISDLDQTLFDTKTGKPIPSAFNAIAEKCRQAQAQGIEPELYVLTSRVFKECADYIRAAETDAPGARESMQKIMEDPKYWRMVNGQKIYTKEAVSLLSKLYYAYSDPIQLAKIRDKVVEELGSRGVTIKKEAIELVTKAAPWHEKVSDALFQFQRVIEPLGLIRFYGGVDNFNHYENQSFVLASICTDPVMEDQLYADLQKAEEELQKLEQELEAFYKDKGVQHLSLAKKEEKQEPRPKAKVSGKGKLTAHERVALLSERVEEIWKKSDKLGERYTYIINYLVVKAERGEDAAAAYAERGEVRQQNEYQEKDRRVRLVFAKKKCSPENVSALGLDDDKNHVATFAKVAAEQGIAMELMYSPPIRNEKGRVTGRGAFVKVIIEGGEAIPIVKGESKAEAPVAGISPPSEKPEDQKELKDAKVGIAGIKIRDMIKACMLAYPDPIQVNVGDQTKDLSKEKIIQIIMDECNDLILVKGEFIAELQEVISFNLARCFQGETPATQFKPVKKALTDHGVLGEAQARENLKVAQQFYRSCISNESSRRLHAADAAFAMAKLFAGNKIDGAPNPVEVIRFLQIAYDHDEPALRDKGTAARILSELKNAYAGAGEEKFKGVQFEGVTLTLNNWRDYLKIQASQPMPALAGRAGVSSSAGKSAEQAAASGIAEKQDEKMPSAERIRKVIDECMPKSSLHSTPEEVEKRAKIIDACVKYYSDRLEPLLQLFRGYNGNPDLQEHEKELFGHVKQDLENFIGVMVVELGHAFTYKSAGVPRNAEEFVNESDIDEDFPTAMAFLEYAVRQESFPIELRKNAAIRLGDIYAGEFSDKEPPAENMKKAAQFFMLAKDHFKSKTMQESFEKAKGGKKIEMGWFNFSYNDFTEAQEANKRNFGSAVLEVKSRSPRKESDPSLPGSVAESKAEPRNKALIREVMMQCMQSYSAKAPAKQEIIDAMVDYFYKQSQKEGMTQDFMAKMAFRVGASFMKGNSSSHFERTYFSREPSGFPGHLIIEPDFSIYAAFLEYAADNTTSKSEYRAEAACELFHFYAGNQKRMPDVFDQSKVVKYFLLAVELGNKDALDRLPEFIEKRKITIGRRSLLEVELIRGVVEQCIQDYSLDNPPKSKVVDALVGYYPFMWVGSGVGLLETIAQLTHHLGIYFTDPAGREQGDYGYFSQETTLDRSYTKTDYSIALAFLEHTIRNKGLALRKDRDKYKVVKALFDIYSGNLPNVPEALCDKNKAMKYLLLGQQEWPNEKLQSHFKRLQGLEEGAHVQIGRYQYAKSDLYVPESKATPVKSNREQIRDVVGKCMEAYPDKDTKDIAITKFVDYFSSQVPEGREIPPDFMVEMAYRLGVNFMGKEFAKRHEDTYFQRAPKGFPEDIIKEANFSIVVAFLEYALNKQTSESGYRHRAARELFQIYAGTHLDSNLGKDKALETPLKALVSVAKTTECLMLGKELGSAEMQHTFERIKDLNGKPFNVGRCVLTYSGLQEASPKKEEKEKVSVIEGAIRNILQTCMASYPESLPEESPMSKGKLMASIIKNCQEFLSLKYPLEADFSYGLGMCFAGLSKELVEKEPLYASLKGLFLSLPDEGKDPMLARAFFKYSAEKKQTGSKSKNAAFELYKLYCNGSNKEFPGLGEVEPSREEALRYLKLAREAGSRDALIVISKIERSEIPIAIGTQGMMVGWQDLQAAGIPIKERVPVKEQIREAVKHYMQAYSSSAKIPKEKVINEIVKYYVSQISSGKEFSPTFMAEMACRLGFHFITGRSLSGNLDEGYFKDQPPGFPSAVIETNPLIALAFLESVVNNENLSLRHRTQVAGELYKIYSGLYPTVPDSLCNKKEALKYLLLGNEWGQREAVKAFNKLKEGEKVTIRKIVFTAKDLSVVAEMKQRARGGDGGSLGASSSSSSQGLPKSDNKQAVGVSGFSGGVAESKAGPAKLNEDEQIAVVIRTCMEGSPMLGLEEFIADRVSHYSLAWKLKASTFKSLQAADLESDSFELAFANFISTMAFELVDQISSNQQMLGISNYRAQIAFLEHVIKTNSSKEHRYQAAEKLAEIYSVDNGPKDRSKTLHYFVLALNLGSPWAIKASQKATKLGRVQIGGDFRFTPQEILTASSALNGDRSRASATPVKRGSASSDSAFAAGYFGRSSQVAAAMPKKGKVDEKGLKAARELIAEGLAPYPKDFDPGLFRSIIEKSKLIDSILKKYQGILAGEAGTMMSQVYLEAELCYQLAECLRGGSVRKDYQFLNDLLAPYKHEKLQKERNDAMLKLYMLCAEKKGVGGVYSERAAAYLFREYTAQAAQGDKSGLEVRHCKEKAIYYLDLAAELGSKDEAHWVNQLKSGKAIDANIRITPQEYQEFTAKKEDKPEDAPPSAAAASGPSA